MILGYVDFPTNLVEAAIAGKLVVFAGAGVSMGAPANLPSFWKLAEDVAQGFGKQPSVPLDKFLGSLSPDEEVVQKATVKILQDINSGPKDLHRHLLNLFLTSNKVRIVTTNFDPLFTKASIQLWPEQPEIFTSPALPLGYDFEGIVHLHGANTHSKSIVITDKGFGKAYLTDGWASRFLMQMFETYTVLFVGYSHDDMVMSYLARALPDKAQGRRYALIGNSEISKEEKWFNLGIEPIYFPQKNSNDFDDLTQCTKQLAEFLSRQPSDWQDHISRIAEQNGPQDLEAEHTIQHALKDISKVRYFTSKASSKNWVSWLYGQNVFEPLFIDDSIDEITIQLELWLLNTFVCTKPDVIFELISKKHKISHRFWFNLIRKINSSEDTIKLKEWVILLLDLSPYKPEPHGLHFLAELASRADLKHHTILIFFKLAKDYIRLKEIKNYAEPNTPPEWQAELEILSPEWNLNDVWEKLVKPNLIITYKDVIIRGTILLKDRLETISTWTDRTSAIRWDGWLRSAIEPHEQDDMRNSIDVILDAIRDSLEVAINNDSSWATRWCTEHLESEISVLRRIAIHGLKVNNHLDATTKLNLLLKLDIHNTDIRHEVFELIKMLYPNLILADRQNLINVIFEYKGRDSYSDAESLAWENWQWLYSLRSVDERCILLIKSMNTLKNKHPELKNHEYPDLHMWSSKASFDSTISPWNIVELLNKNTKDWFKVIDQFKPKENKNFSRNELCITVQEAATKDQSWALEFCNYLINENSWKSDLWRYLLLSFEQWPSDKPSIKLLITILKSPELYIYHSRTVINVLKGHFKIEDIELYTHIHETTNHIVNSIWKECIPSQLPVSGNNINWINQTLNTLEGDIADYWILALDKVVRSDNKDQYIYYLNMLIPLTAINDPKTVYSIPRLCREINFLYNLDSQWTIDHLLLLLNPDSKRTEQAWHGLLVSGGIQAASFTSIKPYFEKMQTRFEDLLQGQEDKFIKHYVAVAFWHIQDPHISWLPNILASISNENKTILARNLTNFFSSQSTNVQSDIWNNWFKPYWINRINKSPIPFDAKEAVTMLGLLNNIPELFEEAVDLTIQMPNPDLNHSTFVYGLQKKDWIIRHSNALTLLIIYLLKGKDPHSELYGLDKLIEKINPCDVNKLVIEELNQSLIYQGLQKLCLENKQYI
ncbi:DUF4020 domain-containing protein [Photobacterium carnosum]|uniref:DUF4020 domain-containing protein n=1 Tax=Photobacterium carnosum TaxID=2023717 RepID=UPI001E51DC45|nr:DUF4020 domain-containing protein [Photobacterium carnosum]MCD9539216.1 DUF4020 domain-containing protein [Photobacterium carnosum]MCF2163796.1 DUF4020 domain-containing protein [Photobacterium carnosum]